VPKAVIDDIRKGGDRALFAPAGYKTLPGWTYRHMWWISYNDHGAFTARGIHGQAIYIDPAAEMVIVRFASSPLAGNVNLDPRLSQPTTRSRGTSWDRVDDLSLTVIKRIEARNRTVLFRSDVTRRRPRAWAVHDPGAARSGGHGRGLSRAPCAFES
jgi:CubicO group peptidase (beta-lactamase class C family)